MSRQKVYYVGKVIEIQIEKHLVVTVHFQITEKRVKILLLMQKKWRTRKSSMALVHGIFKKIHLQTRWIGGNSKKINSIIGECVKTRR